MQAKSGKSEKSGSTRPRWGREQDKAPMVAPLRYTHGQARKVNAGLVNDPAEIQRAAPSHWAPTLVGGTSADERKSL